MVSLECLVGVLRVSGGCLESVSMVSSGCLVSDWRVFPHSAQSLILSKDENLASTSLQEGAIKWQYFDETIHPPTRNPSFFNVRNGPTCSKFWKVFVYNLRVS